MATCKSRWIALGVLAAFMLTGCSSQSEPLPAAPVGEVQKHQGQEQAALQPKSPPDNSQARSSSISQVPFEELSQRADGLGHMRNPAKESVNWVVQDGESFVIEGIVRHGADPEAVAQVWSSAFTPSEIWMGILDENSSLSGVLKVDSGSVDSPLTMTMCKVVGEESLPPQRWKNEPVAVLDYVAHPIETWVKSLLGDRLVSVETSETSDRLEVTVQAQAATRTLRERQQETVAIALGLSRFRGRLAVHYTDLTDRQHLVTDLSVVRAWATTDGIPVFDEGLVSVNVPYTTPRLPAEGADRGMGWRPPISTVPADLVLNTETVAEGAKVTHAGVYGGGTGRVVMLLLPAPSDGNWHLSLSSALRNSLNSIFMRAENLEGVILMRRAGGAVQVVEIQRKDWLALDTLARLSPELSFDALGYLPFKSTFTFTCGSQ